MKKLLAASAASMLATSLALAQEGATEKKLETIVVTAPRFALTAPYTAQAKASIERIAGGVEVIADTDFKNGPASTIKDILAYVPGVVTQPRFGPDARVSIRGSGLSRSYGNRGIQALVDGVPPTLALPLALIFMNFRYSFCQ